MHIWVFHFYKSYKQIRPAKPISIVRSAESAHLRSEDYFSTWAVFWNTGQPELSYTITTRLPAAIHSWFYFIRYRVRVNLCILFGLKQHPLYSKVFVTCIRINRQQAVKTSTRHRIFILKIDTRRYLALLSDF